MKSVTLGISLSLFTLGLAAPALACGGDKTGGTTAKAEPQTISVEHLAQYVTAKDEKTRAEYAVFDANGKETRAKFGVIPGAKLLSDYSAYEPTKELPADRASNVVFYCSSTKCSAAPKAAKKALESGYVNVYVMPAGIMGWSAAGKPTTKVETTS